MIRVENLTFTLPDGREVLRNVSLDVPTGKTMAVMGLSGTGKTSLLKCVAGLNTPATGTIWLGGRSLAGLRERQMNEVRKDIGYVFQYAALFDSMSVYDNVAFGPIRRGASRGAELDALVAEKLALVGMDGTEEMFPAELSGGMQKRVGLARALALNPSILLYDEPTSGLDPITAGVIDELIIEMRDRLGVTSLVVSHTIGSIFHVSDYVTMLYDGEAIITGTAEEVRGTTDPRVRQFIEGRTDGPIAIV